MKRSVAILSCFLVVSTPLLITGCDNILRNSSSEPTYDEYGNIPGNNSPDYIPTPAPKSKAAREVTATSLVDQGASNADTPKPATVKATASDGPAVPGMAPTVGQ